MEELLLFLRVVDLLAIFCVLGVVSYVDLRKRIIKAECLVLLVVLWVVSLVLALVQADVRVALSCAINGMIGCALTTVLLCLFAGVYEGLRKKESLGGGDIKLLAVFGLFLGFEGALACLFFACVISLGTMFTKRVFHVGKCLRSNTFAFAPALCVSAAVLLTTCWF